MYGATTGSMIGMEIYQDLLQLPLGAKLADDNWENHVYELGTEWVYKEIRTEHELNKSVLNFNNRYTLQRFWCSDTHYQNLLHDQDILKQSLREWLPKTYITRQQSRFNDNPNATVTIQKKLDGTLLKDIPDYTSDSLTRLRQKVFELVNEVFNAPLDLHSGNILVESGTHAVYFFDTGTPSDWQYFLDAKKLQTAIAVTPNVAECFATFMSHIHTKHSRNCMRLNN